MGQVSTGTDGSGDPLDALIEQAHITFTKTLALPFHSRRSDPSTYVATAEKQYEGLHVPEPLGVPPDHLHALRRNGRLPAVRRLMAWLAFIRSPIRAI
jgi:hypothetical protein